MNKNLPVKTITEFESIFDSQEERLTALLPSDVSIDFMKANIIAALSDNPKLLTNCTRSSLVKACFEACELGLMVHSSLGEAWIVPYKNRATFIPGYQGLVKLAMNSGFVKNVISRLVYSNDDFECKYGAGSTPGYIYLKENHANRGQLVGCMCIAYLTTGGESWEYYPLSKLEEIRGMSASYKYALSQGSVDKDAIWGSEHNTGEMYRKAVWRNLSKWVPRSGTRYSRAMEISDREYMDDFGPDHDSEIKALEEEILSESPAKAVSARSRQKPEFQQEAEKVKPKKEKETVSKKELQEHLHNVFYQETESDRAELSKALVDLMTEKTYPSLGEILPQDRKLIVNKIKRADRQLGHDMKRVRSFYLYVINMADDGTLKLQTTRDQDEWRKSFLEVEKNEAS